MATDMEKLAMLDRSYALDVARKAANEVAKHLTTLETRTLSGEAEDKVRAKLSDAREAFRVASDDAVTLLKEKIAHGRSPNGGLFDKVTTTITNGRTGESVTVGA